MSSVQSFLRQRNLATSLLQAPENNGCYYVFVATAGNYVGNYPPGYMVPQAPEAVVLSAQGSLIRDMGKTIKAPIGDNTVSPPVLSTATEGFFREVQLIKPVPAVGPTGSTTFGVGIGASGALALPAGGNAGDAGYNTYYLPIVVDGVLATSDGTAGTVATLPATYLPLGGQL